MLVDRPVFDTSKLAPGNVIKAVSTEWEAVNNSYARNILLTQVTPLKIRGVYYNPERAVGIDKITDVTIEIDKVVNKSIKIYYMKG